MKYQVSVSWKSYKLIDVEAETPKEARDIAMDQHPRDGVYVEGSYRIDTVFDENGNEVKIKREKKEK